MSPGKTKYRKALVLPGYMSKIAVALADTLCRLAAKTIIEQFWETGEQVTFKFCMKARRSDLASHSLSEWSGNSDQKTLQNKTNTDEKLITFQAGDSMHIMSALGIFLMQFCSRHVNSKILNPSLDFDHCLIQVNLEK